MIKDLTSEIQIMVVQAFSNAYKLRAEGEFEGPMHRRAHKLRSEKFVSELADQFKLYYSNCTSPNLHCQCKKISNEGTGSGGEWMLDLAIVKRKSVVESKQQRNLIWVNVELIWAIESESDVGLEAFAIDFGKLLCVDASNYLYLNGLNQASERARMNYIDKRLKTACSLVVEKKRPFYLAFWPSPEERKGQTKSIWDLETDLESWVRVYKIQ